MEEHSQPLIIDDLYQYQELAKSKKQIRLLRRDRNDDGSSTWSLVQWDLADVPPYCALSYAWGTQGNEELLCVDNKQIRIRQNLFHFFEQVNHNHLGKHLWVDQICINQNSTSERNSQVEMMAEIYRGAFEVIVWLGPGLPSTPTLLDFIQGCKSEDSIAELQRLSLAKEHDNVGSSEHVVHGKETRNTIELSTNCIQALHDFLEIDYWTRLWPVQEILLAKKLAVHIGTHRIARQSLRTTKAWLHSYRKRLVVPIAVPEQMTLLLARNTSVGPKTNYLYHDLVRYYGENKCSDPRDKLHGLMSLIRPDARPRVDYDLSVGRTYLVAVELIMREPIDPSERYMAALGSRFSVCLNLGKAMLPDMNWTALLKLLFNKQAQLREESVNVNKCIDQLLETFRKFVLEACLEMF
jgi:hypothetical protein